MKLKLATEVIGLKKEQLEKAKELQYEEGKSFEIHSKNEDSREIKASRRIQLPLKISKGLD